MINVAISNIKRVLKWVNIFMLYVFFPIFLFSYTMWYNRHSMFAMDDNNIICIYALDFDTWWVHVNKQCFWEQVWYLDIDWGIEGLKYLMQGVAAGKFVLTQELVNEYFVNHHNSMMDIVSALGPRFKIYYIADLIEQHMSVYNVYSDWLYKECAKQGILLDIRPDRKYFLFIPRKL